MIVEEWVRTAKPAQPPAENSWYAEGDQAERKRWRRVRRQRTERGTLEDSATGRAKHLIPGTAKRILAHERMDETDNGEARAGRVTNRGQATLRVPAPFLRSAGSARRRCRQQAPRGPQAYGRYPFLLLHRARPAASGSAQTPDNRCSNRRNGSLRSAQPCLRRRARGRSGSGAGGRQGLEPWIAFLATLRDTRKADQRLLPNQRRQARLRLVASA